MMTRRQALKTIALASAAVAPLSTPGQSNVFEPNVVVALEFNLPPLPYAVDALEPHIDARTMEVHHDRHHKAYVDNLNKALVTMFASPAKPSDLGDLEMLVRNYGNFKAEARNPIRNHGGGHYNHSLFWQMMKKEGGGEPKNELGDAITKGFGSFADFKTKFSDTAMKTFGSGWAWLTLQGGKLAIESTPNQDSPISQGKQVLLGLDVWEHAYYLKYQNKRADYVAAWWNVVNWDFVADRYVRLKG